jgi:hypothetical protein
VGSLFAAFLGYNPIASLLEPSGALHTLSSAQTTALTGKTFFPELISGPFHAGLVIVFVTAAILSLIGAAASLAMGGKYVHSDAATVDSPKASSAGDQGGPESQSVELSDV